MFPRKYEVVQKEQKVIRKMMKYVREMESFYVSNMKKFSRNVYDPNRGGFEPNLPPPGLDDRACTANLLDWVGAKNIELLNLFNKQQVGGVYEDFGKLIEQSVGQIRNGMFRLVGSIKNQAVYIVEEIIKEADFSNNKSDDKQFEEWKKKCSKLKNKISRLYSSTGFHRQKKTMYSRY